MLLVLQEKPVRSDAALIINQSSVVVCHVSGCISFIFSQRHVKLMFLRDNTEIQNEINVLLSFVFVRNNGLM